MEFCPIVPTSLLEAYAVRSKWQMCVAAWGPKNWGYERTLENDPSEQARQKYWNFYKSRVAAGDKVILDNGAYEGRMVNKETYIRMIEDLKPFAYVVPDQMGDLLESWKLANGFPQFTGSRRIVVFQGNNQTDFSDFLQAENNRSGTADWIALPKRLGIARADYAKMCLDKYPHLPIHALGFIDDDPLGELPKLAELGVQSIDSSEPIFKGQFPQGKTGLSIFKDLVHGNCFNTTFDSNQNLDEVFRLCRAVECDRPPLDRLDDLSSRIIQREAKTQAHRHEIRPRYDLIPIEWMNALAEIFEDGLKSGFGEHNWKSGDEEWFRDRVNHAQNHLSQYNSGDRAENHLAKAAWGLLARRWWDLQKSGPGKS